MNQKIATRRVALLLLLFTLCAVTALAQTTSFTYQGRLTDGGTAANGNYDLQFALFDTVNGGAQIATQTSPNVLVSAGIFTVQLDFGATAFPGAPRFLEISARLTGTPSFTLLAPRQQITSTPYAIRSASATAADTATNATNATNATQLGGVAASQYVLTGDSRLTDARAPTAGSGNYIQNTTTPQAGNFNITGNGTVGGNFIANGNVGIGTVAPAAKLHIAGSSSVANVPIAIIESSGTQIPLAFRSNGTQVARITADSIGNFVLATNLQSPIIFRAGDVTDNMVIRANGNVGIGTATPQASLHVKGDTLIETVGSGGNIQFGTPGGETGMTMIKRDVNPPFNQLSRVDMRFDGSTLKLVTIAGPNVPASTNGIAITTAGDVGIGTTAPLARLHVRNSSSIPAAWGENSGSGVGVVGSSSSGIGVSGGSNSGDGVFGNSNGGNGVVGNSNGGNGVVGSSVSGFAGQFNGPVLVSGTLQVGFQSLTQPMLQVASIPPLPSRSADSVCFTPIGALVQCGFSSLRFKTNVQLFRSGLDIIRRLRPISFNWKQDGQPDIGLGGEDVAKVAPAFVLRNSKGEVSGVNYNRLNILLINAVKEQQSQIETLRTANTALNARLRAVEQVFRKRVGSSRRRR